MKKMHTNWVKSRIKSWIAGLLLAGWACGLGGCEKPVFTETLPRSQFERYDRLHGRYAPMERPTGGYGAGTEPALRQRLFVPPP